jgi:peroxiredoxin
MKKYVLTLLLCFGLFGAQDANADAKIGAVAPAFETKDTHENPVRLSDFIGKIVVLEWTNHGCPFVVKHYESGNMQKVQKAVAGDDVVWISIVSSAEGKQGAVSATEANKITQDHNAIPTHKILDPSGEIGHAYGAMTTPHMFIIDKNGKLAYKGAIDDHATWREAGLDEATNYVVQAVSELRAKKPLTMSETKPYGCSVKY